jgi:nucleoid-associated protein YgaU
MLVIRKEIKVGFAITAAVLGVAVIYGGMSLLGNSSKDNDAVSFSSGESANEFNVRGNAEEARSGLPPVEDPIAAAGNTGTAGAGTPIKIDPFAESTRADGSDSISKWTALSTGRVPTDTRVLPAPTPTDNTALIGSPTPTIDHTTVDRTGTGPITTITPAPTNTTTVAPAAGKYKIVSGDTFSSIAAKLYGNRNLYHVIEKANPGVNPARLKIGQEINVPAPQAVTSIADAIDSTPTVTGTIDTTKQYRVQAGDTLHRISQKLYGQTKYWSAIYDLNKAAIGPDAGRIKVGTVLNLPQIPQAQ